ncbi:MAG: M56 family metallopeptidase, partial [Bryobacteraceae bacterium]
MTLAFLTMWATRLLAGLGETLVRSTVLALACLLVAFLFRRRTAELRHLLWHGLLLSLLLMPLLQVTLPPLRRPALIVARSSTEIFRRIVNGSDRDRPISTSVVATRPEVDYALVAPFAIVGSYVAVAVALLLRLATGLTQLRRLTSRSKSVGDADLQDQIHSLWLAGGCGFKARVCESAEVAVPLTLGIWEPVVVLPVQWRQWDRAKREAVLLHEMAHLDRNDMSTLILASLATCFYWFHPLAWMLKRHLALLAEQACDERVIRRVNPEHYAAVLIEIARDLNLSGGRRLLAAVSVPMVKSSQMKSRLKRILAARPAPASGKRVLRLALVICLPAFAYLSAAGHFERRVIEQNSFATPAAGRAELEAKLATDASNLEVRAQLLTNYFTQIQAGDSSVGEQYDRQLLWLIANHPEAPVLGNYAVAQPARDLPSTFQPHYEEARNLWISQLNEFPDSAAV